MAAIAAGVGVGGSLLNSYLQSNAAGRAADQQAAGQNAALTYAKEGGMDQNYLNLLNMTMNRQSMLGPMQNQLGANNLLAMMLGINPQGASTGGNALASGASSTSGGASNISGNQITLPGTGQVISLPAGYDLNSIFGPVSASNLNLTPGQTNALSGSLLQTGVTQQDIQNQLGAGLGMAGDVLTKSIVGGTAGQSGGGVLSALGQNIYELYGMQAPQIANQMRQQQLSQIFNELQGYATGSPAAVTSTASTGQAGTNTLTGQIGTQYGTQGQIASNLGSAGAQGTLGQANAWSTGANNISSLLTKYFQSQGGGGGGNAFNMVPQYSYEQYNPSMMN